MKLTALDRAFNKLPQSAPASQEIEWVRAHPALFKAMLTRKRREEIAEAVAEGRPLITAADIKGSRSYPESPSKGAATKLLAALKDPEGWQKDILQEHKKGTGKLSGVEADDDSESVVTDDLEELAKMLKAASGG